MSHTMSLDGTTIEYDQIGSGPTVILLGAGPTDRTSSADLAELLAASCTVINYDRRGRGGSGDARPFDVDREAEDLIAVAACVAGPVNLFTTSGGIFIATRALDVGMPCARYAAWEPPYILPGTRPAVPADYAAQMAKLAARDDAGAMAELFLTVAVGMPPEVTAGLRQSPFWPAVEAAANPALLYDARQAGDFLPPTGVLGRIDCPALVLDGGTTPWLSASADTAAAAIPGATRQTLAGQQHNVDAAVLAPVLAAFFTG